MYLWPSPLTCKILLVLDQTNQIHVYQLVQPIMFRKYWVIIHFVSSRQLSIDTYRYLTCIKNPHH